MKNHKDNNTHPDEVYELLQMYFIIKGIVARLVEIEEAHPLAENLLKGLRKAVSELDDSAHLLYREMYEIKALINKNKKRRKTDKRRKR